MPLTYNHELNKNLRSGETVGLDQKLTKNLSQRIEKNGPRKVNVVDKHGHPPLHAAIVGGM